MLPLLKALEMFSPRRGENGLSATCLLMGALLVNVQSVIPLRRGE